MDFFIWPIRIYYEDTDAGGVVFHTNYLNFFERARTEMLRAKGFEQDEMMKNEGIMFVVHSIQVNYHHPARFNEQLEVHSKITQLKRASLLFEQYINRQQTLLCQATISIACLNINTLRPTAIPLRLRAQFQASSML